ncbi:hypothetical protein HK096_005846, partial [Nowakowskiella sp. JEL0078]
MAGFFTPPEFYEQPLLRAARDFNVEEVVRLAKEQVWVASELSYRAIVDVAEDNLSVLHVVLLVQTNNAPEPISISSNSSDFIFHVQSELSSWKLSNQGQIVSFLLAEFPQLINSQCTGQRLGGLTPLHIACANGNLGAVVALTQEGAKVSDCHVFGTEFMTVQDNGCLYLGSTPLHFATVAGHDRI